MAKAVIRKPRKKVCQFCKEKATGVDYKDTALLRKFISDRGKIRARRVTGNCVQHQRDVAIAVKNAREVALLPYTSTARWRGWGERAARAATPSCRVGSRSAGPVAARRRSSRSRRRGRPALSTTPTRPQ